ncbi:MAG: hypothetical protein HC888_06155 [Candidatus Competibacteraceae bacterium]|nr:hypothetical protein [Candidatus Competibacteraceae bacterium]
MEDFEHALQVDVLACSLRLDKDASGDLLEHLSAKLAQALLMNVRLLAAAGCYLPRSRWWSFQSNLTTPVFSLPVTSGE